MRAWLLQPGLQHDSLDAGLDTSLRRCFGARCPRLAIVPCEGFIGNGVSLDGDRHSGTTPVCVMELAFDYIAVAGEDTDSN